MVVTQETRKSPRNTKDPSNPSSIRSQNDEISENNSSFFSPRFKSMAAMAGWDEEALFASLVVEDTPERNNVKQLNNNNVNNKRSDIHFKTPPTNSRRKRRAQRRSLVPVTVLNLDDDDDDEVVKSSNGGGDEKKKAELNTAKSDLPQKVETDEKPEPSTSASCSDSSALPCMDRLREELSCAICLEICFEPSTTPCGHSFCKKCLRFAADRCGKKCPKCRQLISNGRSCTVNTVLWNTIQLLFPEEVQARKATAELNSREADRCQTSETDSHANSDRHLTRRLRPVGSRRGGEEVTLRSRRGVPSQDDDAALALRLQREEFMSIYRGGSSLARDNLRAMAQRAVNNRVRSRAV